MSKLVRRLIVLYVDRDNDVGERLGVPTPIIGRGNVLKVATEYILRYPDDSDANAMFGAIQLYDTLISTFGADNVEIAVVTGTSSEDVTADMKILNEVDKVLQVFDADGFVVVSDGPSDEVVVPLIQSRRPVVSVRRIVVKQTRGFEEFAVLARYYIGKLFSEPRYRRYALGIPGALLLIYGAFYSVWPYIPTIIRTMIVASITILLGIAFILYGFNLHESLLRFLRMYEATFFISALSIFFVIIYSLSTYYMLHQTIPLWGALNVFDLVGLVVGAILTVNVVEVYIKFRARPFGRIAADVLLTVFLLLVASDLAGYMFGKVGTYTLLFNLMIYTVVGLITLIALGILRNRYGKVKGGGKSGSKGIGVR
ncbi:DUF373 family protein [Vulcanisaeta sp. JCM 16161]|uniref:DUF373 family protein n=1 Tax=Vulcanisaeta sp. JCM 16161 TaxID=1295372 RepID=UPI00406C3B45